VEGEKEFGVCGSGKGKLVVGNKREGRAKVNHWEKGRGCDVYMSPPHKGYLRET